MSDDPAELERFYTDTIAPLVAYDEQYGTELMLTLETFLANDGSMAATYKELFTHRHTIRYRLERVKELTGLDVNSTDGRERLGLGLKAMRVLGVRAPSAPVFEPGAESGRVPKPPTRRDARPPRAHQRRRRSVAPRRRAEKSAVATIRFRLGSPRSQALGGHLTGETDPGTVGSPAETVTPVITDEWEDHYQAAVRALLAGRLTPFLGAGANLYGRTPLEDWEPQREQLPCGSELAEYLASSFNYPYVEREDLVRISQFISIMDGPGPLMDALHNCFDADYPPTPLHSFLANTPRLVRDSGMQVRPQLIVTTNYDDALERAFDAAGEEYDLVSYMTTEPYLGRFVHWSPGAGEGRLIDDPHDYIELSPNDRTVILKIHGLVDRTTPERSWDSFVITEDHYIEYLTRTDISRFLPPNLVDRFKRSNFLFLGYSLRDWNLRAILQRIWQAQRGQGYANWAVLLNPEKIEKESWEQRRVQVVEIPLDEYVTRLEQTLRSRLPVPQSS